MGALTAFHRRDDETIRRFIVDTIKVSPGVYSDIEIRGGETR